MDEPKKGIGLVIDIKPNKKPKDEPKDAMTTAAEDLIASVKQDDVEGVKAALLAAYMSCESEEPSDEAPAEEG